MYGIALFGLALLWLAPASLFRPVALVLLIQWVAAELTYQLTGNFQPTLVYLAGDIAVCVTVLLFRSHWSDWLVVLSYPVVWWAYTLEPSRDQWLLLYWIVLAQFLIAGPWPKFQRIPGRISHGPLHRGVQYGGD